MKRLVIATNNPGKAKEMARILSDSGLEVLSLRDFPAMVEPEETGKTFEENAIIKALAVADHTGETAIADDSGLVVDALDGAPGIYSSRFAGEEASDDDRNQRILDLMKDVPEAERAARFVAVAAVAEPGKVIGTAEGKVEGIIGYEPRGENGFGYDPIFFIPEYGKTTAELSPSEKDEISHRGKAIRAAKAIIVDMRE